MNKTNITGRTSALVFSLMMVFAIIAAAVPSALAVYERNYTLNADFDEGILANVEHDTISDQLQLSKDLVSLPLIWVPNSDEGTVSKVDTDTGKELGRYYTGSTIGGSPSRTTVDLMGNVWFGNRNTGTVVKIGLVENGQCKDNNTNGIIETSKDLNNDGNVTGSEILPWGTDECVLYEITGIPGARGIAIDSDNNLWAGAYGGVGQYKHIDGETGAILATVPSGKTAYGAVIDANGILWSSEFSLSSIGKFNTSAPIYESKPVTHVPYGMGIDANSNLFISGWTSGKVSKYDISSGSPVIKWTTPYDGRLYGGRGVVVTSDGDVWVAVSMANSVVRLNNTNGAIIAAIPVGNHPTGVSVDNNGKVWVVNYYDGYIKRIDPATNTVDLEKLILGNSGTGITHHYGYSDMTGYVARTITTKTGTWTVVSDSGSAGTPWGTISWNSAEPAGATVNVRTRSSPDNATWSPWEDAVNNVNLAAIPDGRYLQTETRLQITSGDISSVLFDLKVKAKPPANQPPVAEAGGPYTVDEGSTVILDGSGSTDPDVGDSLTYEWDLNNDGIYETPGMAVTLNPADGPVTMTVGLKVTDSKGASSTDTAMVTVNNVAPAVEAGPDATINEGGSISSSGSFTDPGADTWTATVDYGSGPEPLTLTGKTFNLAHTYPDNGVYTVTVAVTDKDGGVGTDTMQVTVNNVAPVVGPIIVPVEPQSITTAVTMSSPFTDVGVLDTHTAVWDFGDGTTGAGTMTESGGSGTTSGSHIYTAAGIYTVSVTVTDKDGGIGSTTATEYVVVYDPNGGFVTGGGWINSPLGAYNADPAMTGRANFGFVSKYQKGATVPTGNTEFQFRAGDLNFHSTSYEWLVVAGARAQFKGSGTINGAGDYGFMLTATDSAISGGGSADKFRIKIVDIAANSTVYDNQLGVDENADPTTEIAGGNIVIHKGK